MLVPLHPSDAVNVQGRYHCILSPPTPPPPPRTHTHTYACAYRHKSTLYTIFYTMVVVVNMLLVFLEPPSSTFLLNDCEASSTSQQESACWGVQNKMQESRFVEGSFTPNFAAFLLEMFCCAIYAVDIFVLLRFYGLKPVLRMANRTGARRLRCAAQAAPRRGHCAEQADGRGRGAR